MPRVGGILWPCVRGAWLAIGTRRCRRSPAAAATRPYAYDDADRLRQGRAGAGRGRRTAPRRRSPSRLDTSALSDVRVVTVDGADLSDAGLEAPAGGSPSSGLDAAGRRAHGARRRAHRRPVRRPASTATWTFTTDTHGAEADGARRRARSGRTAPSCPAAPSPARRIAIEWKGGALQRQVGRDGQFRIAARRSRPATTQLTIAVRDAAGNRPLAPAPALRRRSRPCFPRPVWPTLEKKTDSPVLIGQASDNLRLKLAVAINGETVKPTQTPTGYRDRDARPRPGHADDRRPRHRPGRQHVAFTKQLLVDSTEKLKPT